MTREELEKKVKELQAYSKETEWLEFKENNSNPQELGEYISAISNSALLHGRSEGYIVFGIEDGTHQIVGTNFDPKKEKKNDQEIENWLATQLL